MIYDKTEDRNVITWKSRYSKTGEFIVIEDGVMSKYEYNPEVERLVACSVFGFNEDNQRFAIFVPDKGKYKQLGKTMSSKADAIKIATFVASVEGEAHVVDIKPPAVKSKTEEEDPEAFALRNSG